MKPHTFSNGETILSNSNGKFGPFGLTVEQMEAVVNDSTCQELVAICRNSRTNATARKYSKLLDARILEIRDAK